MRRTLNKTSIRKNKYCSMASEFFVWRYSTKNYLFVIKLLFLLFIFFSPCCKAPNPPDDPDSPVAVDSLGVSIVSVNFTAEKDASLIVIRTNKDWTATESADWLSLSATSGNKNTGILIGAMKNDGFPRETTVTIVAGDKTSQIKVTQAGASKVRITSYNVCYTKLLRVDEKTFLTMINAEQQEETQQGLLF